MQLVHKANSIFSDLFFFPHNIQYTKAQIHTHRIDFGSWYKKWFTVHFIHSLSSP